MPVVAYTLIDERHQPTGGAPEFMCGERFVPAALAICRDVGGGFFLFGCDAEWNPVTDTWHPTLEGAQHQAELQYGDVAGRWEWC